MSDAAAPATPARAQTAYRVLVVDDDPDMAAILARLLRASGMEVELAEDGAQAVLKLQAVRPDLVLMDVMLPDASGFELCARFKADAETALVPIVLVTALEDHESRVQGIEAGADDFLTKPVRREELLARVKTLRRLHETRKELESRRLEAEIEAKEALRRTFSRYVSPKLAERIMADAGGSVAVFSSAAERADVVALFADLRGFTRLTEALGARVVGKLNQYFSGLTEIAYRYEGTIFSMGGDSLLVGFNVPFPQPDAPLRAFQAARDMIRAFQPLAADWRSETGVQTGLGIGIAMGEVVLGDVGSEHYSSYTIIGNAVNVAARLMQQAAANEILMSEEFQKALGGQVPAETLASRGEIHLRGKSEPVRVFCAAIGERS